jgi:uncharacterized protein (TIGR03086 family)
MPLETTELYRRAAERFGATVHQIKDDHWHEATPCGEWDVRDLVNHVVGENYWARELLAGRTMDEVGDRFDGDLLGTDPKKTWDDSSRTAVAAVTEPGALDRTTHLSFGDVPGREYVLQLFADLLIHGWDLARAIGADEHLDSELVDACATWFARNEDAYRRAGAIGPKVQLSPDADAQTRLLSAFGRTA